MTIHGFTVDDAEAASDWLLALAETYDEPDKPDALILRAAANIALARHSELSDDR